MTYVDWQSNVTYALNTYVWALLQANLGITTDDYEGAIPIIPRQQQPEFMQLGKPFLVYGSSIHPTTTFFGTRKETVAYNIYAPDEDGANTIAGLIVAALERQDDAARDVNDHLDKMRVALNWAVMPLTFGSIKLALASKAEPADDEGGFVSSLVMLECLYTCDPVIQTTGFTYT